MSAKLEDLKISTTKENDNVGVYTLEPLPTGLGSTIGNSLRRVILTSIRGAAVTQLKLNGTTHQFAAIPGIKEDVVEVTLNLKKLRFKMHSENPIIATVAKKGPGAVTGADITLPSDVEIMNKEQHIATLADSKTEFKAEITIESGVGYSPMEERQTSKIGVIVLDAVFSPVVNVTYEVESTRFEKRADLDKIILTVETDGSVKPLEAVKDAARTLTEYYSKISMGESSKEIVSEIKSASENKMSQSTEEIVIEDLPLQTRTINALRKHGVKSLQELARMSDEELSDIKNLGEKSLKEIKKLLEKEGHR